MLLFLSAGIATAQTNPPPASYVRTSLSDVPNQPLVTVFLTGASNVSCLTIEEDLPSPATPVNISGGGKWVPSLNAIRWGPYFNTVATNVSYRLTGPAGSYPVNGGSWMDGAWYFSPGVTMIPVVAVVGGSSLTGPPSQLPVPIFAPISGASVPTNVTISCAITNAAIYYTLDGSMPTTGSLLYTGAVQLASSSTVLAKAFATGWTPSQCGVAYYAPPAAPANAQVTRSVDTSSPTAPVVTFSVTPGTNASCFAVIETLPPGLVATGMSAGGHYLASNNVVLWGPFFGTNALTLSYQAAGQPGNYPVQSSWSVDGVGGGELAGTNIVVASVTGNLAPTPPPQEPMPMLSPGLASNLPVTVAISSSDPQAQIYFTTDGTLPTQSSTPYTTALNFNSRTTLRAVAFRGGYVPSASAVGDYVPVPTTNAVAVAHSVSGNGSFLPTVSLLAAPQGPVSCYAVVEPIPSGLTPSGLSGGGIWDPIAGVIRWGPYLDNQPRVFSYNIGGQSGTYPLSGLVSFDGYSMGTTGASALQINANYSGSDSVSNLAACATDYLTYNVNINPAPGVVTVTSASGTISWGDGTQTPITQPVMTFEKSYSVAGTYSIVIAADWTGYSAAGPVSGHAAKTDSVQVVTTCLAPQIATQPSNQVVLAGSTVQFIVSASSSVPMTYQWYFDQTSPILGTIFSSLTLPNIAPQSAGSYSVVITNAFGSTTSSNAILTVVTPLVTGAIRNADGSVTLSFIGLPNTTTRIWAATDLMSQTFWQPIFTNTSTGPDGTWQFTDTNTVGNPAKFYRFSTP